MCDDEEYPINYNLTGGAGDLIYNTTLGQCDSRQFCTYMLHSDAHPSDNTTTMFCDAYIDGVDNMTTSGNFALLFGLYLACKILWAYAVGPCWNFVDAMASKKCQTVGVDWSVVNVMGCVGAVVAPLITGNKLSSCSILFTSLMTS